MRRTLHPLPVTVGRFGIVPRDSIAKLVHFPELIASQFAAGFLIPVSRPRRIFCETTTRPKTICDLDSAIVLVSSNFEPAFRLQWIARNALSTQIELSKRKRRLSISLRSLPLQIFCCTSSVLPAFSCFSLCKFRSCDLVALLGGSLPPDHCLVIVLWHTMTLIIEIPEHKHRIDDSLFSQDAVPLRLFSVVLLHSVSDAVHSGKVVVTTNLSRIAGFLK